ncbi:helicase associated domain-containing protein [Streptomyces sp. NPDC050504]|uniref:helicase associated domain-containing protein n=1 Tax=Streptomyces sp. NPDC050504 TaxID=3365618 RepID=UPI0037977A1C
MATRFSAQSPTTTRATRCPRRRAPSWARAKTSDNGCTRSASAESSWAVNMAAARQFHGREGHLRVPRKHVEQLAVDSVPRGRQHGADGVVVKLGMFVDNARRRADRLTGERRAEWDELGMRW